MEMPTPESGPRKVPVIELDLSKAEDWNGREGERDYIIGALKRLNLYKSGLLFRGFDGEKIESVQRDGSGTSHKYGFHASTESELVPITTDGQSALDFAMDYDVSALAIYDKDKLFGPGDGQGCVEYEYKPKDGHTFKDALVAILILNK